MSRLKQPPHGHEPKKAPQAPIVQSATFAADELKLAQQFWAAGELGIAATHLTRAAGWLSNAAHDRNQAMRGIV